MIGIVLFNVAMLILCAIVGTRLLPANLISALLEGLHNTIGITLPPPEKVRMVALVWMGLTIVVVDGALFMLVFFTTRLI